MRKSEKQKIRALITQAKSVYFNDQNPSRSEDLIRVLDEAISVLDKDLIK